MDRTTAYAERVVSGAVVAGPHVRAACRRHLADLKRADLEWRVDEAERAIRFFPSVLTVEIERKDEFGELLSEVVPFELHESQCFVVGSLCGWFRNGVRRFRTAYVEQAKGNGKSPTVAGLGLYFMLCLGKERAEVYAAAAQKDQALICFRDAVSMWQRSPALAGRLIPRGQNPVHELTHLDSGSFFRPISSENKGKSGARVFFAAVDEVHEHPSGDVIGMLRAGVKSSQGLIFEITNSGFDRESICYEHHEYSTKIVSGELDNDSWFAFVCSLDKDDDPFSDESCWVKANPLLGVTIQPDYIREQVKEARGMPSKESLVRRLHFCEWTDAEQTWVGRESWERIEADLDLDEYAGRTCFGGLDLSYTTDLSAFALVFPDEGDRYDAFLWFFKPREGLKEAIERDKVPYDLFAKQGHLVLTEGAVIKLGPIAEVMAECASRFTLQTTAYDRYRHRELQNQLADDGIELPMQEHPQGFRRVGTMRDASGATIKDPLGHTVENPLWMPSSVQSLENAITENRLRVKMNKVLRWNVASVVVRPDPAGTDNHVFDKRKSTGRIDGVVALAMAVGAASLVSVAKGESVEVW